LEEGKGNSGGDDDDDDGDVPVNRHSQVTFPYICPIF
jgi:hypothetical protein